MKDVYKRIKETRLARRMTQDQLAELVGYHSGKSMISQIERGLVDLPTVRIVEIANALNVTPAFLLGKEANKESQLLEEYIMDLFHKLNEEGRKDAQKYLELLVSSPLYSIDKI